MNAARAGFTLLETMIVVAIVAVLAAVALPSYTSHVERARILEAVTRLSDLRARLDVRFLDEQSYVDALGDCGVDPSAASGDAFTVECRATATTFTLTARGNAAQGMSAFVYTIDETGVKVTRSAPAGWLRGSDCWTIRRDGFCV